MFIYTIQHDFLQFRPIAGETNLCFEALKELPIYSARQTVVHEIIHSLVCNISCIIYICIYYTDLRIYVGIL